MEILATLFGSSERVRIMRYCIIRPTEAYDVKTVAGDLQIDTIMCRRELKLLAKIGFIKEVTYTKEIVKTKKGKAETTKEKTEGYRLQPLFPYLASFKVLLQGKEELAPTELFERFKKLGKIELFVVSGVFNGIKSEQAIDLLIVGNSLKRQKIESQITEIENFIGCELTYAIFDTDDFMYRYMMHDKFVREILRNKGEQVVNTLRLE